MFFLMYNSRHRNNKQKRDVRNNMKKIKNENTKNVFMVISSNLLTILIALFTGFVIPKQLSVADYAYYHVYMLYIAYAGFLHFGFVNGIYLKYGKYNEDELPIDKFRKFSKIMFAMQGIVVAVLAVILLLTFRKMDINNVIAYAFIIINIPLINIKWFYSSINQFTKRFVIDSYVTYLQNILTLLMVICIVVTHWYYFEVLLIFTTAINAVCMVIVMWQNKNIVWGKSILNVKEECVGLIKSGFFLMLSEFVGIIILGIDSIFVQNLFSIEEFAMYSFAVSIITVIYTMISTVSNLIYPYLVRVDENRYAEYYCLMSDVLSVISIFSLLAFYVAKFIIDIWLDKYTESIAITAILFGTVIFRSLIMLVCGNYFKVLKMIKEYTQNNVFAICISFLLDLLAYLFFHDYIYIAIASLISFIIWYVVTDWIFIRRLNIPLNGCVRRYVCIVFCLIAFYALLKVETIVSFFAYAVLALLICVICFKPQFVKVIEILQGGIKKARD